MKYLIGIIIYDLKKQGYVKMPLAVKGNNF